MPTSGFKIQNSKFTSQVGQTLIETMVAVFILVMGISAAVGLAIYAFNSSTSVVKQIVATGLAREGLEAVKNMRDTNWLKDTLVPNGCYDFVQGANHANCYQYWLGKNGAATPPFCINPSPGSSCNGNDTSDNYYVGFDSSSGNFWSITKDTTAYGLNFDPNNSGNTGYYTTSGGLCSSASSEFCRSIIISKSTAAPYDQDVGPLVLVKSQIWWVDKKCPRANTFNSASPSCRLELDSYLTNWKNF